MLLPGFSRPVLSPTPTPLSATTASSASLRERGGREEGERRERREEREERERRGAMSGTEIAQEYAKYGTEVA
eukprot:3707532-Rhodomonas_salina.1